MTEHCWAQFIIPTAHIAPEQRPAICKVFACDPSEIDQVLAEHPGFDTGDPNVGILHQTVHGCPCLCITRTEWLHAGLDEAEALVDLGLPHLYRRGSGQYLSPVHNISDGQKRASVAIDPDQTITIHVIIDKNGTVVPDPDELAEVEAFVAMTDQVFVPSDDAAS